MASANLLRRVAPALTLAIAVYGAGDAKGALHEGQFSLFVTDPGSVPLEVPFTGTFQFDDSLFLFSDLDGLYFAPVQSATITGGDSETCCYVYDPLNIAKVAYSVGGHPYSIGLFFGNAALESHVYTTLLGLNWAENKDTGTSARSGVYTMLAPELPAIPEPSAIWFLSAAALALFCTQTQRNSGAASWRHWIGERDTLRPDTRHVREAVNFEDMVRHSGRGARAAADSGSWA
jgi:hypothetical protein